MTYSEFVKIYPALDLFLELFKGLGPTLIAILAIVLNHRNSVKRDKENRRNGDIVKVVTVSCSLLTSFSASYVALTRCLEKWKIYRDSIESIKRLLVLYWVDQIDDQNLKTLVNDLEALKGKEYERWSSTYNAIAKTSVSRGKSEENSAGKDSGTSSK